MRRAVALLALFAVFNNTVAFASPPGGAGTVVDPRLVALMRAAHWCGETPRPGDATATTETTAGPQSLRAAYALAQVVGARTHGIAPQHVAILIDEQPAQGPPTTATTPQASS
ncbi:MAG: hypothetical protein M3R44_05375, partial [Candidatus Eremiobacteraeota bacterium]|nr:hypothetical protein [Candidatus Eremiobacteraeota bacterium]